MRGQRISLICTALLLVALVPSATARSLTSGALLRPLHLPHLEPGAPCPVSHVDPSVDFARFGVGPGIGPGPVYPLLRLSLVVLSPASAFGSAAWGGAKVLWFVAPRYRGPVVIRGRRLDGRGLVRFDRGAVPSTRLFIRAGLGQQPSFTRLRAPGCYAYQIDGTTFSRVIVFRATGTP